MVTNVGDSRAYHISTDGISRVTKDHSLVESMVDRGDITAEEARHHPNRNLITRALGPDMSALSDGYICPMAAGDFLLLCSDGLVETVTDQESCLKSSTAAIWAPAWIACWPFPRPTAPRTM